MPKEPSVGKPARTRLQLGGRDRCGADVRTLRKHRARCNVARQLGYGVQSVRNCVRQADMDDGHARV